MLNTADKTTNIHRLKKLTGALIDEALKEIRSSRPNSPIGDEKRLRTAEYFLLEARDYVDGAWEMLVIGNVRTALAVSRWTLEAALNLLWVVSNQDETEQQLTDLAGEALRQDANLLEGLAELWPKQAHALKQRADEARQVKGDLACARLTPLETRMKDINPPDRPNWPNLYVHYRVCCAASHPGLKLWERFTTIGQATILAEVSNKRESNHACPPVFSW